MKKIVAVASLLVALGSQAAQYQNLIGKYEGTSGAIKCEVSLSDLDEKFIQLEVKDENEKKPMVSKVSKLKFKKALPINDYQIRVIAKKGLFPGYVHLIDFELGNAGELDSVTVNIGEKIPFTNSVIVMGQNWCNNLKKVQ